MKIPSVVLALCACVCFSMRAEELRAIGAPKEDRPLIQMAILLDTSSSMNGLIDQARGQLWKIVNEFVTATRHGQKPVLQVALYQYGSPNLGAESGFVRQIVPLTDDLDKISKELFALTTNGGDEYCGWVIKSAVEQLQWSQNNKDMKVIFIAGNEPFNQGSVDYKVSCKAAIEKGIMVNTIHCGPELTGVNSMWKDGATLADGQFSFIDQNKAMVHIDAPQDKELAKLNEALNTTYVAYGSAGREAQANQIAQDANAGKLSADSLSQRVACKSSTNYSNGQWDLVDLLKSDAKKIEALKPEELPDDLKKLTVEERKAFVEKKSAERAELQKQILALHTQRTQYVADEMKKRAGNEKESSLDQVMSKTVRAQAEKKEFKF